MIYLFTSWHTFGLLSNTLSRHDALSILFDVIRYFWRHDVSFHIMVYLLTYLLTSWLSLYTFWHHVVRYEVDHDILFGFIMYSEDIMTYFMTNVWTSWYNIHPSDVMYCLVSWPYFLTSWLTFVCFDAMTYFFDAMTYFLTLWRTFWRYDVIYFRQNIICDVMMYLFIVHTFWHKKSTSWR